MEGISVIQFQNQQLDASFFWGNGKSTFRFPLVFCVLKVLRSFDPSLLERALTDAPEKAALQPQYFVETSSFT
jgi:hypothetical protein